MRFEEPTQNGVRRHESRDLREQSATETVSQFGQTAALTVFEAQSMSCEPSLQEAILFAEERDRVGLLTVDPAAQGREKQLSGSTHEVYVTAADPLWDTTRSHQQLTPVFNRSNR